MTTEPRGTTRLPRGTGASLVAAAALAGVAACGGGGTGPDPEPAYFPLATGNSWTYVPADPRLGDSLQWRVSARHGDTVTVNRPASGSHSGPVTLLDGGRTIRIQVPGGGFEPHYEFVPGASWIHSDPWDCDDGAAWVAVVEPDPIVTPAGTYDGCLRLERRSTASCADAGTMIEWWAPGVGLVRWDELNFFAGGPLTYHLVRYSID